MTAPQDKKTLNSAGEAPAAAIGPAPESQSKPQAAEPESQAQADAKPELAQADASQPAPAGRARGTAEALTKQLEKTSHKQTASLLRLRKQIRSLAAEANDPEQSPTAALLTKLTAKLEKNHDYQEQLKSRTCELIENLKSAMEAGQSQAALPTWDQIQANVSKTAGKIRSELQAEANPFKAEILKLRDWKLFAATEKKKELIQQMQTLKGSNLPPPDISKQISGLHKQWQALGRSQHNNSLWLEFKNVSDEAYEPCKAWFKQRKQVMAANLQKRHQLCDELETKLTTLADGEVNLSEIGKLLSQCENTWKQHAPVEQSKIKAIQKRYYSLINQLRRQRKAAIQAHAEAKKALIEKARQLSQLEDNQAAMNEAKALQKQWQKIGPTTFKEDKTLWGEFRAACDRIFSERQQQVEKSKQNLKAAEERLKQLLREIESLLALEDGEFRQSRNRYQDLLQEFSATLDPKMRHSKTRLIDHCNDLKRRYHARQQALPDKKHLALQQAIQERSEALQQLEDKLLASPDASAYAAILSEFEPSTAPKDCADAELEALLSSRLSIVQANTSPENLQNACQETADSLRDLCIEMEIKADSETPAEDQGRRMELQLKQLQEGFGQTKPERKEILRHAQRTDLRARCLGPLASERRAPFLNRLQQAAERLR